MLSLSLDVAAKESDAILIMGMRIEMEHVVPTSLVVYTIKSQQCRQISYFRLQKLPTSHLKIISKEQLVSGGAGEGGRGTRLRNG